MKNFLIFLDKRHKVKNKRNKTKKETGLKREENELIIKEIIDIKSKINQSENWFNNEIDRDMIEASIYCKKFLNCKLNFLLRLAKLYKISLKD